MYRALRALERDGLVHSAWAPSAAGPDRRIYHLTRAGMEQLHDHVAALAGARDVLEIFLSRYAEFVALPRAGAQAGARP